MLTEEAYHMFVGEVGVGRVVRRAAQLVKESKNGDARELGGILLDIIQKYVSSDWLPALEDREYVRSLMKPVTELGKIANWIAPPKTGVNHRPFEFEYVRL
jgi:hypothetical protein